MRISKPSKGGESKYLIFNTTEQRDAELENGLKLSDGQEIKILDGRGDGYTGWVIYKYDKENNKFDILETEQQPDKVPEFSKEVFAESLPAGKLTVLDSVHPLAEGLKILQDFDFDLVANQNRSRSINMHLRGTINNYLDIPIVMPDGSNKFLNVGECYLTADNFTGVAAGEFVHWNVNYDVYDMKQGTKKGGNRSYDAVTGKPADIKQGNLSSNQITVATIRAKMPASGVDFKQEDITVFRHWKKALVPAEERIISGGEADHRTIDYTDKLGGNHMIAAGLMQPYQLDIKIMQDFDYKLNVNTDGKYMEFLPNGGTDTVVIPIQTPTGLRYAHLMYHKFIYYNIPPSPTTDWMHWSLSAVINDDPNAVPGGMMYGSHADGTPLLMNPVDNNTGNALPICQVKFKRPKSSTWKWYAKDIIVFKYWKQILAPAEERISISEPNGYNVDKITLFEEQLREKTTIIAPALAQPLPVNFWILEDFDFNFVVGKTYTGNKPYLRLTPVGGLRQVPVLINGVRKYLSIASEDVIMPDLFGGAFGGAYKYFTIQAKVDDVEGAVQTFGTSYKNGDAWLTQTEATPNHYTILMVGVKFNTDHETLDWDNVIIHKFWKDRLASFNELWKKKTTP
jgi:hypothetical protein